MNYRIVSGALFALVSLIQLIRAVRALPVQVGHLAIPVSVSWLAFFVTAAMSIWAFRSK